MDHQPFEDWIFRQNEIEDSSKQELNQHMDTCQQCTELNASFKNVENLFLHQPMVSPTAGFTNRFAAKMALEKEKMYRKQSIRSLVITGIILIIISIILVSILLLSFSAGEIIIGAVSTYTGFIEAFINLRGMVFQFLNDLSPLAIVFVWLLLAVWGGILTPLWGITVWKLSKQGVELK